jgi:hypothetical protein
MCDESYNNQSYLYFILDQVEQQLTSNMPETGGLPKEHHEGKTGYFYVLWFNLKIVRLLKSDI